MTKNIWITGASSGIGKALAIKFATEGWHVAASARRENLLQELNNNNLNIHSFPLDVRDESRAKKVFQNKIKKFKTIDIAVYCTGIHDPEAEKKLSSEKIREIMWVYLSQSRSLYILNKTYIEIPIFALIKIKTKPRQNINIL